MFRSLNDYMAVKKYYRKANALKSKYLESGLTDALVSAIKEEKKRGYFHFGILGSSSV